MLTPDLSANVFMSATTAGACASIASEIAYTPGLETSHIDVMVENGRICLRGTAPDVHAIGKAVAIASEIVGYDVRNRIALRR
jgi:osmotically-inducible protein OsmY